MDLHEEEDFLGSRSLGLCELDLGPGDYPGQRKLQIVDLLKSDPQYSTLWEQRIANHEIFRKHRATLGLITRVDECYCEFPSFGRRCNCGLHVPGIFGIW